MWPSATRLQHGFRGLCADVALCNAGASVPLFCGLCYVSADVALCNAGAHTFDQIQSVLARGSNVHFKLHLDPGGGFASKTVTRRFEKRNGRYETDSEVERLKIYNGHV